MSEQSWQPIDTAPVDTVIETKIDDVDGVRNVQPLKRMRNTHLWWLVDGTMYVYYTPTHWRPMHVGAEGRNDKLGAEK